MELTKDEMELIDKLAELLAKANTNVDKAQIKRQLASYAEGIKAGVTMVTAPAQATAQAL